ncbi:MAG TPA: hypothetical protein DHW82_01275 [Spirochaetia bacterium]|nr:MAG: hypothetical protein A2Y41_05560 [Spirochaetes bacterium GWB1_36_13]HCL55628.1 hypothetical protein [Spirochaetia bacterium]
MRFLSFFIFSFFLPLAVSSETLIRLLPCAKVSGLEVELGEIASIETDTPLQKESLQKIVLFKLPEKKTVYDIEEIRKLLFVKIRKDFILTGDKIEITPFYTKILEYEILEKTKKAVLENYPATVFKNLQIFLIEPLQSIQVPYGDIHFRVLVPKGNFLRNKSVRLEIFVDQNLYYSKSFFVKLKGKVKILSAKKKIKPETPLDKKNFKISYAEKEYPELFFGYEENLPLYYVKKELSKGNNLLCHLMERKTVK